MENKHDLKVLDQTNDDYLREVEAPEINDLYLRFIQESNLAYYRKLLGEMKKETRDLLDSGLFEKASAKVKRMLEKERKKKKMEKTPPRVA